MDLYLRNLSISNNTSLEDITYPCIKLLDWIYKISLLSNDQLSTKDVSNLGKAVVYLNTCYQIYGDELTKYLLEKHSFYEDIIKTFFLKTSKLFSSTADVFENLSKRNETAALLCCLESASTPITLNYKSLLFFEDDDLEISESRLHVIDLFQSLIQLPKNQMNIAIERAFNYMPFSTIGLVFCEPVDSYFSDICLIMTDYICQQISNITVSKFFISSLRHSICISRAGMQFFWVCLANAQFSDAIQNFVVLFLSKIFEEHPNAGECPELFVYKGHKLNDVLYITWTALASESPCQNNLFKSILESPMANSISNIMINFDRIYE